MNILFSSKLVLIPRLILWISASISPKAIEPTIPPAPYIFSNREERKNNPNVIIISFIQGAFSLFITL